ncbi:MAG: zf-TFIIB domain-containing protein [Paenisporosarcina sp.]
MNCPVCDNVRMREVEKENILIDVCPDCKGVWLDRGELEKITQGLKEDRKSYTQAYEKDNRDTRDNRNDYEKGYDSKYSKDGYPPKHKRKKSMVDVLGDLLG